LLKKHSRRLAWLTPTTSERFAISPQAGDVPAAKRDAISALDLCKAARDALPRLDQAAQRAEQAADAAQAQPQRLAEHFGDVAAGAAHEAAQLTRMAQQAAGEAQDAADAAARAIGPLRKEDATLRADAAAERANELADRADRQAGLADRAAENAGAAAGNLGHDPANPAVAVQVDARTPAQEAAHQALQQAAAARADADSAGTAAGNAQRAAPGRDSDSTASDSADSPRHSASSGSDSSLFSSDSSDWRLSDSSRMDSLRSGLNDFLDSIDEQPQHGSETSSRGGSAARSAPELASMLTPEQADRLAELQEALERNGGASTSKDAAEQRVLEAAARGEIAPQELLDALRGTGADATDARNRSSDRAADQSRSADADRMQLGHGLPLTYDKTTKQLQTPDGKPLTNEFLAQHEGQTISIEVNGRAKDANVVAVQDRFGDKHFAVEVKGTGGDLLSPEGRQVNKNKLGQASDDGRSFVVLSLPGGAKQGSAAGESDKTHNMAKGAQGMADRANQAAQRAEQAQGDAADLGDSATRSQVQPLHNTANAQAAVAHKAADNANTKAASAKQEALAACEKAGITSNQQLEDLNRKNKKDPESLSANEKNALSAATHYQQAKASAVTADASAAKAKQASDQVATRLQNAAPDPKADATKPQAGDKDAEPARIGGQRLDNGDAEQRRIMSSLLRSDEDLKKQLEAIKVKRGDLPDLDTRALAHDLAQRARNGDSVSLTQQDVNLLTKLYDKLPQDSENKHGARLGVGLSNEQLKGLQAELSKGDDGVFDRNTLTQVADLGRSSKADDGDKGTQRNHRVGNSAVSSIAEVAAALAQTASPQTLDKMKPLLSDVAQTVGNMSEKQAGELVDRLMNKEASPGERKSAAMDFVEQVADTAHNLRLGEIDTLDNAMDANRTSAGDATPRSQRDMDTLKEVGKKIDAVINDLPKDAQEAHALKGLADLMDAAVQPNAKGESSSQAAGLEFGADPGKAGITQRDAKPKPDGAQTDTATRGQSAADGASTSSAASSDPAGQSNQGADTRSAATDRSAPQDAADGAKPTPTSSGPKGETVNADPAAQRSPQTKPDTTQTDTATPTQRAGDGAVDSAGTTTAADPNRGAASGATTTTRNPGQTDGADAGATGVGEPPPGYPKPGETLSDRTGGGGTKTDRSAQSTSADGADGDKSGAKSKSGGSSAGRGTDDIARNVDGEDEILENPDADLDVGNQVEDNTTGAGAGASGSAGVTRTEDGGYAAAAEGRAGATAQAGGSFDEGAVSGSGSVQVGPEASGKASAHAGPTEVEGSVQGEVSAAKAEGEVTVGNDNVNGTVGGSATAGAGGEASAGVSTTGASAKVDAFAGAEATASAGGSVAGGAATGKAEAGALVGVGAGAGANVGVDDGVLTVGGNLKLALGIGLSIDFSLKIDFNKIFGKEKNPFEDIAKGLNELNGGKTQYSGAQLEFYARAYVKDTPDGMTAEQLLQKMSDDGLLSKGPDGTVALGGTPTTANGQHSLATSILSTGGGAGATSVNADGLAKALNFANRGDTETTQKAQAMINLYGNGQTIDEAGLKRAMADGALAYGNAESIYNGQKETTWGLKMQADTNKLSDASMGQMLGSAGTDGKTLAATINNMNSQYYGSKEAYVGDHQAQFALNGYTSYGMSSQDAVNQMIKDKVIVRTPSGELNLDYGAMVTNAHSADPTAAANGQHRLASSLLVSGGAATDGSLDAKGLTNALNMANRGDASYGPQMDQMVKRYGGADGRVDHNELQAMVRDGAINMGPIQTTFNGQVENTTGISVSAPSMAGKTSYQITNDIVQTTGLDGAVDPTELTGWCAPGQTIEQVNVLAHGYSRDGQLRADGLQAMIDDGVLVVGGDGKLRANPKAAFDNAHSADPAKATLGQERLSMMLTTHGSDSSDTSSQYYMDRDGAEVPERITSAEDTALAMNQLAGREVVTADQVPGMLSSFTQFNNTDHSNLRENNTRYAVATGAIYWDPATGGPALNTAAYA
jgi:hypothetical protein